MRTAILTFLLFFALPLSPFAAGYDAHFGDMDTSGDDAVTWDEFQAHFPHAKENVHKMIDQSGDGVIDHDEWHMFKRAHGYGHAEGEPGHEGHDMHEGHGQGMKY